MNWPNLIVYAILAVLAIAFVATVGWKGALFLLVIAPFLPPNGRRGV